MGDAQSAQRDGTEEAAAEEQSAPEGGPSAENTLEKLAQNNGKLKPDGTIADVNSHKDKIAQEAVVVKDTNVEIIQEGLSDPNEEEIINVDAKQNDLNESFRRFFSNIGLKLTVKKGSGDQADAEVEKEVTEKLGAVEETSETKYEDVEQTTDLNVVQDNDSTTCPTMTDGTSDDVAVEEKITVTKEKTDQIDGREDNVTVDATVESETAQEEEIVSPIKKFFTTGIFAGLKKKKTDEEANDKELDDMGKNDTDATVHQKDIVESSPNVEEQTDVKDNTPQAMAPPEVEERAKSPSTDQDSESELTSSQEKVQLSPFKRLFSGTTFKKRRSKREKGRRSSDSKLSDSGEQNENLIVASSEKTEQQDLVVEAPSPPPPSVTQPEEELSAWEAFKKLMTPKKKRASIGSEDVQAGAVVEEAKPSEGERISDHSTEEGRKRKDSAHSWEAVLCGSGRRRSRKTSDSEDEQKQSGEVESLKETRDVTTSTPKRAESPSSSESSTWKSFKKLMTPKRKIKDDEESKDIAQSDSEATQEETLFSIKKILPGRKKRPGDKQDQLSSDEGENKEMASAEEESETPAVIPLSEFDKSETEDMPKTDDEIQDSDLESEQEHILEIPKTFVQEVQEHQVTPIIALSQDQDELTEFSKYQPLSDIPEEGNITETAATSLIEDVVKDDTIAEDMVELTSEAITAPEPVDITMADETDELMLSAASHLTESSKTSGNATPVPAEYDAKDTEVFLKEVADTISIATKAETVCSEMPATEEVTSLVTHETFEPSANEEQIDMEMHAQSEAVTIETGLKVDQLEDIDIELPVTVLSESLSEFKDAISTQYVSEVSKVEFESAKVDVDEVHSAEPKMVIKQESVDDSDYMIESLSEVPESVEIILQDQNENEDVLPDECQEEPETVGTESTEKLLEEKLESNNLEALQSDIQEDAAAVASVPELPKSDLDSVMDLDKEEVGSHETLGGLTQIEEEVQLNNTCKDVTSQLSDLSIVTTTAMQEEILGTDISEQEEQEAIETTTPSGVNNVTEVAEEGSAVDLMPVPEVQLNEPETEEIEAVQLQEGCHEVDTEISKELRNNQTMDTFQTATETNVEVETEDEFEIVYKEDVAECDTQESTIESQNQQVAEEETTQEEETNKQETIQHISTEEPEKEMMGENDQETTEETTQEETTQEEETNKQETIQNISTEEPEQEIMGENDQETTEHPTSPTDIEANEKEEFITEVTTSKESREEPDEVVLEVAISRDVEVEDVTNKLSEEIFEEELINQTEPTKDEESVEQKTEEVPIEATKQDEDDGMEDKHPPDAATDEIDYKTEVCETMDNQQEMVQEEGTNAENGFIIVSEETDSAPISQPDYSVHVNGDKSDTKPSEAQILRVNDSDQVAEDLKASPVEHVSSIIEDSGIAQVLEDTVHFQESSELCVSKTEEPIHEVHLCEKQVSVEGQLEEEIPCPETEVAEVQHAALLEESMASLQQAAATMPDLMIQNSVADSEKIAKETSIPCVDNAEVISEPEYEVQLSEIEQVGVQGEKEEEIIPPETTNVDIQHTLLTQQTICSFKDVASQLPNVTIVTTTTVHEPVLASVISEQEEQEAIETTTPLEVNNVTQVAQEGSAAVLMHVPRAEFENNHPIQVQVVNVDIQSAEPRVDKALEIGVQEDQGVVDSCHETDERLDSFSATSNIEQEMESEKDKVTIKEIVQHLKAIPPESEEKPDEKEQPIGLVESKLSEDQKIESNIKTEEQVLTEMHDNDKDIQKQPSTQPQADAPGNTAVALAQNAGIISSVGNIEAPSSVSLEFKLNIQFGQSKALVPSPQAHFTTEQMSSPPQSPSAAPPVDKHYPAKTTEVSEIGVQAVEEEREQKNEPQTSEFEVAEAAVQATEKETDLKETLKNEEMVDVGIQLDSIEEPIQEMSDAEMTQNKTVLMHVSTQATEISEQSTQATEITEQSTQATEITEQSTQATEIPEKSTQATEISKQSTQATEISEQTDVKQEENALAENQPISIDVGTQSMHQEESNEDVQTTVEGVSIMPTVETVQPEPESEEKRVVQSKLVVLQVSDDKIKQMEDEDENQDVWMDAEEDIDNQQQITTLPLCEIEESFESQPDYFQESKTDFEESLENLKKIALKCDFDSEGEDFAVALEDPQIETAIATVEWD